ncbi:hypothetical protein [Halomonas sp.]|uniref:DUF6969 family protein n=1 Tax=Halomonas sp. TaxID=1486246 RepID=UPI00356B158D
MARLDTFSIGEPLGDPSPHSYSAAEVSVMATAADEALSCQRELNRAGRNIVGEILEGQGAFVQLDHYPKGDVYDGESGSQVYYHAHRREEHGHFHLFHRPPQDNRPGEVKTPSHLVAISMDRWGAPIGLFTTNRWVTGERWRSAEEVIALATGFRIDHDRPSWLVNRWITAMVKCCRPQIDTLLRHRDREIARLLADQGDAIYEDRRIEVIGQLPLHLPHWCKILQDVLTSPG